MRLKCSISPRSPNRFRGRHWSARHKHTREIRDALYFENECLRGAALRSSRPEPPLRVTYERRHARCAMDVDNVAASVKPVLDALTHLRVIEDDNPSIVAELVTTQRKVAKVEKEGFVITLETIEP